MVYIFKILFMALPKKERELDEHDDWIEPPAPVERTMYMGCTLYQVN